MLHVYVKQIPKNMICDVDGAFMLFKKRNMKDPVALKLVKAIDGAIYHSDNNVETPFGLANINQLSSGCKAALLAIWTDAVVNFTEAGDNVYKALLKYAKDRDMYVWTNNDVVINSDELVCVDGKKMTARDFGLETIQQNILRDCT